MSRKMSRNEELLFDAKKKVKLKGKFKMIKSGKKGPSFGMKKKKKGMKKK